MRRWSGFLVFLAVVSLTGCVANLNSNPTQTSKLAIATTALPGGTVGIAYSSAITASGGTVPYTYSASGLPSGLSISSTSGSITGTPALGSAGTSTVAVTVTDASSPTAQQAATSLPLAISATTIASACSGFGTGDEGSLNGYIPFPASSAWNTDISGAPVDPNNALITSGWSTSSHLHPDFSAPVDGGAGIPYVVVDSSATPLVPINVVAYAGQSDVARAPFPDTAPVEGAPAACTGGPNNYQGDQHVLVLDRNRCMLYETFNSVYCNGSWAADSETIWDLQNGEQRPWGWTSADAAGLPIFPGLIRYDEVASGAIHHAIRFTMAKTKDDANGGYFEPPASHAAGLLWGSNNIIGMRIRLKASFDISSYSATNQIILTAMKKYGLILADNGSDLYFQGAPDPNWNDTDLHLLNQIYSTNFEVVDMTTPPFPGWDSSTAPTGPLPTISSFTASATTVSSGTPVILTWQTSNDSYDFIDLLGGVRGGSVTFTPTATATYTLNATNQYGRTSAQLTVTVH